jgi:DNA invertase Pin-like site-specific DNA recombinase
MLIGYMRVSKTDGTQLLDLQRDALLEAGVKSAHIYEDLASGKNDDRPGLDGVLKAARSGDTLVVWKIDRLGRNLSHLVTTIQSLNSKEVQLRVLVGHGMALDTTTSSGKLIFNIFAALAEFERELIIERTKAGLAAARARGRAGGAPFKMTATKIILAMGAMGKPKTKISSLCAELRVSKQTLYRHVSPSGELRADGHKILEKKNTR